MKPLNAKYHKQAGGTLLGLILGLIVGLGIAVGVALMITKSPIPFVNKVTRPERADPTPAQAADPNRPLYGNRDIAREAARDQQQSQTPVPPNTAAAQPWRRPDRPRWGRFGRLPVSISPRGLMPLVALAPQLRASTLQSLSP